MAGAIGATQQLGVSSFGDAQTGSSAFRARTIVESERYRDLDRRQAYYDCTHNDWMMFDFEGRILKPGAPTTQPLLTSENSSFYVPLKMRRPSSPYRLPRLIVNSFTALLFGDNRWPTLRYPGDADAQDYSDALSKAASLPAKFIQARNYGGSTGTVGLSWCFYDGKPRVEVHSAKYLYVHEWADRQLLIPAKVSELYRYPKDEWDPEHKIYVRNWYWFHRFWGENEDIVFEPVLYDQNVEPQWTYDSSDPKKYVKHDDGECHFVWIQNLPTEEIDGSPDYDGLYENFDTLDQLCSVMMRGAVLNLDPTLVLKLDPDIVQRFGVKKGSDNALLVGETGGAEYLELEGSSIEAGLKLFEVNKRAVLDIAQCVVADPNEIASAGVSSITLKLIYRPMTNKGDILREQYGEGYRRLMAQMMRVARAGFGLDQVLKLSPKVETEPGEVDAVTGKLSDDKVTLVDRNPGHCEDPDLSWPEYFPPTPADQQAVITTLSTATAMGAVMSQQTAAEEMAKVYGRDADAEWKRIQEHAAKEVQNNMQAFGDPDAGGKQGGSVNVEKPLPGGGKMSMSTGTTPQEPDPEDDEDDDEDGPPKKGDAPPEGKKKGKPPGL